jgi:hypothetical protein
VVVGPVVAPLDDPMADSRMSVGLASSEAIAKSRPIIPISF